MKCRMIVFEGIDGAGKGTLIELLKKELKKRKLNFSVYKYPTKKAKKIREYLKEKIEMSEDEAFFEYLKDIKKEQKKIRKSLLNKIVICDRYFFSTLAYQSIEKPIEKRIELLKNFKLIEPDVLIWLDISPKTALERKLKNKLPDRFEQDLERLKKIRENYQKLYFLKLMAKKWIKLDAIKPPKKIFEELKDQLDMKN